MTREPPTTATAHIEGIRNRNLGLHQEKPVYDQFLNKTLLIWEIEMHINITMITERDELNRSNYIIIFIR